MPQVFAPVKLLHESIGHTLSIELRSGECYRGHLMVCEDSMNIMMEGVTVISPNGMVSVMEQVYLRG